MYCENDLNFYELGASFTLHTALNDLDAPLKIDLKDCLNIANIIIDYERYKVYNVYLEDNIPNGNMVKILNDYFTQKTSFAIAEINLDGSCGVWKEKRIQLVDKDFFKYNNPKKLYSRVSSLFLLNEKY